MKTLKRLALLVAFATGCLSPAFAQTDSIVCRACVIDAVTVDSAISRIDTVYTITLDTTYRDSVVTVFPPQPPVGVSCPNMPAGFRVVSSQQFDGVPPLFPATDPAGWFVPTSHAGVRNRLSASNGILTGLFPKGAPGGSGPFRMDVRFPKTPAVYDCIRVFVDSNFTRNGNAAVKFGFYLTPYAAPKATNHFVNLADRWGVWLQSTNGTLNKNFYGPAMNKGRWAVLEVLVDGTTGWVNLWLDGKPFVSSAAVLFFPGQAPAFTGRTWNPTYGGGHNPVPYDMRVQLDYWVVAVR